jgi:hypothetical protein
MPIVYPLNLPAGRGMAEIRIRKSSVVGLTRDPYGGVQQAQVYTGQWWEADVTLPLLLPDIAAAWEAFLGKINGREGTFLLGDPLRAAPRGAAALTPGTPVVDGAHAALMNELSIADAEPDTEGYLLAGDYIQLGSGAGTRLHQVLEDADTDGDGKTTLLIWPILRTALSNGASVVVSDCKSVFRMAENEQEILRARRNRTSFSFRCFEDL